MRIVYDVVTESDEGKEALAGSFYTETEALRLLREQRRGLPASLH